MQRLTRFRYAAGLLVMAAWIASGPSVGAQDQDVIFDERLPAGLLEAWKRAPELVGSPTLAWTDRELITVAFNGGDDQIRRLIEKTSGELLDPMVGVRFSFRTPDGRWRPWSRNDRLAAAAIRIDFSMREEDGGYWSALGRMALVARPNEQTMNLGDLLLKLPQYKDGTSADWSNSYAKSTILHEFGHALGLSHEHFHPHCQADLKIDEAVTYFQGPPNKWSESQAKFNIDASYYFEATKIRSDAAFPKRKHDPVISASIDRKSLMMYRLKDKYYKSGAGSPCKPLAAVGYATAPSDGDRAAIRSFYPKRP